jgi:hypothetical protein
MMPVLSFKFPRPSFYRGVCPVPSVNFGKEHRHAEPSKRTAPAPLPLGPARSGLCRSVHHDPQAPSPGPPMRQMYTSALKARYVTGTHSRVRSAPRALASARVSADPAVCHSLPVCQCTLALSDTHWQPMTGSLSECQTATASGGLQVRLRLGVRRKSRPSLAPCEARPGGAG